MNINYLFQIIWIGCFEKTGLSDLKCLGSKIIIYHCYIFLSCRLSSTSPLFTLSVKNPVKIENINTLLQDVHNRKAVSVAGEEGDIIYENYQYFLSTLLCI